LLEAEGCDLDLVGEGGMKRGSRRMTGRTTPPRAFKAIKSVCQRCMRIRLNQAGKVVLWNDRDEVLWLNGLVHCPQQAHWCGPSRNWCLRAEETDAIQEGNIGVWDERPE
jgi:hypothetical protein